MALISCPECRKADVSDSARTCPNCGYKIYKWWTKDERAKLKAEIKELEFTLSGVRSKIKTYERELGNINDEYARELERFNKYLAEKREEAEEDFKKFADDEKHYKHSSFFDKLVISAQGRRARDLYEIAWKRSTAEVKGWERYIEKFTEEHREKVREFEKQEPVKYDLMNLELALERSKKKLKKLKKGYE